MARTSKEISQAEAQTYYEFAKSHPELIVEPYGSPEAAHNAQFVTEYFEKTWPVDLTAETMAQAYPLLRPHLKLHPENRLELGRQLQRCTPQEQDIVASFNPKANGLIGNEYNL